MQTLLLVFQELFYEAIKQSYPHAKIQHDLVEIMQSASEKFGHYQCNSAMKLSKLLQQPPRAIAQAILQSLHLQNEFKEIIDKVEIAGPGFINVFIRSTYLSLRLNKMLRGVKFDLSLPMHQERIIVDFSSPNIAKEMHVGHLRSTIIGDAICRLFEFYGDTVLRINHIGDWGTAFGMLIAYMKQAVPKVLEEKQECTSDQLLQWYKAAKKKFDDEEDFKKQSHQEVVALQSGDPKNLKIWEMICKISQKAYQEIYDLLDIKIQDFGESFYNPMLKPLIHDLDVKGLIKISDGAKCIFIEGFKNREGETLPLIVQKSDGGFTYDTTDLAALRYRVEVQKADRVIYITDQGQGNHFSMIFKAAQAAGYVDPDKTRLDFAGFGLVLGADGKKFKTRSGDTEKLLDLIHAAVTQAKKIIQERTPDLSSKEQEAQAMVLGVNAIKYADLSCNRHHDYVFSYEKMLRFEGNTATFLLYAYVRILGIKRRLKFSIDDLKTNEIILLHPSEIDLGLHLCRFAETLEQVTQNLLPSYLTDYLYVLAEKFNAFFRDCRVEDSDEEASRLLLCDLTGRVLQQGLELLGLKVLERM